VKNRVGVEKVDIHKNGAILGDRKCLGDPRKSFVGHSDATQFGTSSSRRVFQQPLAQSHTEHSRNTAEPNLPDYGQSEPYCLFAPTLVATPPRTAGFGNRHRLEINGKIGLHRAAE
jgi:hypothetical protein